MKNKMEVTADVIVSVKFCVEVEPTASLESTEKHAREVAERIAMRAIGVGGDSLSATLRNITSLTRRFPS